ncbi:hypothetical protein GCM10027275_47160 [Rhabdobacter roseus]|uniref:NAD(P)-dependent dehydrogenase (Short-subunit alcohol dehydrogenase family) n=1 Tax=Rhabdobacter roseus TaxID=1655419 RepID=A0A840TU20_9BACT|nr:SDR family NAD(P)-dependent oxidoreductase [Rhabdobacter roseus]MBB5286405.1 NAD(P)-dependent dehydrogenase (short-subunit alcohol dehydrogenase family) [Rhabdobacter roseus]
MTPQVPNTALITGANSGIGLELTKRLLQEGWHVRALIRSDFPATESTLAQALATGQLRTYRADLSQLGALKAVLKQIIEKEEKIDVLFNNAAVSLEYLKPSPQKRDLHFEVNALVPYLILRELKPLLLKGTLKTVVNTSSNALLMAKKFNPQTLQYPTTFRKITGIYGESKLALSLWTSALAPSLRAEGITIRSVCPGGNKTPMTGGKGMPGWLLLVRHLFFSHPRVGAGKLYAAAFDAPTGAFINKGKATPLPFAHHAPEVLAMVEEIYQNEY